MLISIVADAFRGKTSAASLVKLSAGSSVFSDSAGGGSVRKMRIYNVYESP
jgi:hypothetical protein